MSANRNRAEKAQKPKNNPGEWLLLLTALIWGSGFIAQRQGMRYFGPFTFIAIRFWVGGFLVLCFLLLTRKGLPNPEDNKPKPALRALWPAALACGLALFGGTSLQQQGLMTTTAGKAGFITALYIVFVPVFSLFLGKKVAWKVWLAVLLAALGLYFLSIGEGFSIAKGDLSVFLGAIIWACHILLISHFSARVNELMLACGQFFVTAALASLLAILKESFRLPHLSSGWWTVLHSGMVVVGVAFTLQVIAQKSVNPSLGALILSLESVFALVFGMLLLHESPTPRELFGCLLVAAAVLLVQWRAAGTKPENASS
ncbi:MAG: DMT family transporter [Anaerolineaceae bacterium]|nr:DMT family transporter [Anaerolineaceae bacterium]